MAYPGGAEVEDAAFGREDGAVVGSEGGDRWVVDVRYEARGGVEGGVGGGVLSGEVGGVVGSGGVAGGVGCYAVGLGRGVVVVVIVVGGHGCYSGGC